SPADTTALATTTDRPPTPVRGRPAPLNVGTRLGRGHGGLTSTHGKTPTITAPVPRWPRPNKSGPVRRAAPAAPPPVVSALRPAGARRRCPAAWGPPGSRLSRFRPGGFSETVGHPVDRPGARPPPALRLPRCGPTSP